MVVACDTKSGTLHTTAGCMNMAYVAESASNSSLWYNRLGYMSVKGMKMLAAGCMNMATVAESASNSSLWYNRLGYMSVKGMKMLAAEGVL